MSDSNSMPWPPEDVGPKDHLHALGVISVYYNLFEEALGLLFSQLARYYPVGEFLFRRLNNQERLEALKFYFVTHENDPLNENKDPPLLEHIEYLVSYCGTCIDNRNILMHSKHNSPTDVALKLSKTSKATDSASKLTYYQLSLEELRGVGDELIRGTHYIFEVYRYIKLNELHIPEMREELPKESPYVVFTSPRIVLVPQSLPEKPPKPKKLQAQP